jgi:hypothetical protein
MPCPALSCLVVAGGVWLIRDPRRWMLVKILATFIPVHGFLLKAWGFLPGSHDPAWVGVTDDVCTLHQVIIAVGDETCLCSWVYAVRHACLIICQVMNAPLSWS